MATTSHDVRATLGYYQPKADGSPPDVDDFSIVLGSTDMDAQEVVINDVRGKEDLYNLDENGFKFVHLSSGVGDFADDEVVKSTYYPEIEELIIKNTGASKIFIFNHMIRSNVSALVKEGAYLNGVPGPAPRVHIDQTPKGAGQLLYRILSPDVAADVASRRWQIINAWKPLATIRKDPLAISDSTTISESNQVAMKRIYADGKEGENCTITAKDVSQHKWYYLHEQQPDEILLFKQHESDSNVKAKGTPHCSFPVPGAENLENRRSIEVRAIVSY